MKTTILPIAIATLTFALNAHSQIITGFGNTTTGGPTFTVDGGNTDFATVNLGATAIQVIGTDTNILAGTFDPISITGSTIQLTGFVSGTNPSSQFFVELYNSDFTQYRLYSGLFNSFGTSSTTVNLTFVHQTASFTTLGAFLLTGAGMGDSLNFTLDRLEAIPEPSTYALLGLGGLALWGLRRLKARA